MERIGNINPRADNALTVSAKPSLQLASRQDLLLNHLAMMAVLRGDSMSPELLVEYSKALLEFKDDLDTLLVLEEITKSPRAEYEPKIPELGNLLGMVRERRRGRLEAQEQALREQEWEKHLQFWRDHPEERFGWEQLLEDYKARQAAPPEAKAKP